MKKIILLVLLFSTFFTFGVDAYSLSNVLKNTQKYEKEFQKKLDLSRFETATLEKLKKQIETMITSLEKNTTKSNSDLEIILWKLLALQNLVEAQINKKIIITVIDDKRCTDCNTAEVLNQLKMTSFLTWATFIEKDFSDTWIEEYLKKNNIKKLPAFIFSTNQVEDKGTMKKFFVKLEDWKFSLMIWAKFDPFLKISKRWFTILDKEVLNKIKISSYLKWSEKAEISLLEYSDLECPFCANFHTSGVIENILTNYGDKVNTYFNSFPLEFHKNAFSGSLILECLWEQKWADAFYSLIEKSFQAGKSEKEYLLGEAEKLWADKNTLEKCVQDEKYKNKITEQKDLWLTTFWITWTPATVVINNNTGEYKIITWALPFDMFEKAISALLENN